MKCRWRKDSDALIRRNGVVAEGGTGGTAERDGQEGQLWQGGRVSECVWVSSVSPASLLWHGTKGNARQKRKKPIRVVACAACGCHWGRGRGKCGAGGGGSEQGLSQIISYYPAINLAKCFCCRGLVLPLCADAQRKRLNATR